MFQKYWIKFIQAVSNTAGLKEYRGHHFYPGSLNCNSFIIDLGAHRGEFSKFANSTYGCSILGLEANPQLFASLPDLPKTKFLNLAINQYDAAIEFYLSNNPEASSIFEECAPATGIPTKVSVDGITLDSLLNESDFDRVDLMKVDIESAEFMMLETSSQETLSKIDQITVEFHIIQEPSSYSAERFNKIRKRLELLGFQSFIMDRKYADVLFINGNRIHFRSSEKIAMMIYRFVIMRVRFILHRNSRAD